MKNLIVSLMVCGAILSTPVFTAKVPCYDVKKRFQVCIKSGRLESVTDKKPQQGNPSDGENDGELSPPLDEDLLIEENIIEIAPNAFKDLNIMKLNISFKGGPIKVVPKSFKGLPKLQILNIRSKIYPIQKNLFKELTSLNSLSMSFDGSKFKLEDALEGLGNLQILEIYNSSLNYIAPGSFNSLTQLTNLNLISNQLTKLEAGTFEGLEGLDHLSLEGNRLTTIKSGVFNDFEKLDSLTLKYNAIKSIEKGAFSGLELGILDLSGNSLATVEAGPFKNLKGQSIQIRLSGNFITNIHKNAFDGSDISKLFLKKSVKTTDRKLWKLQDSTVIVPTPF